MRILFVDDDPNVLAGIRRALHGQSSRWELSFAVSGAAGLEALRQMPHDAIVTDARMPGMDGAELLQQVKERYPQIVRIVLSGAVNEELAIRTVGVAHQYLTKPCSAPDLIETLRRTEATSALLRDERIRAAVTRTGVLPSAPELYTALTREINSPRGSVDSIGRIVLGDPAMTAQVLRLVNSSFFGIRRAITHPGEAVAFLGLNTMTALVLCAHVFQQVDPSVAAYLDLEGLWLHGVVTGRLARAIMESEKQGRTSADQALSAGLLHDVGRPVLAMSFPDLYRSTIERANRDGVDRVQAERDALTVDHAEVGGYLLGLWGLPSAVSDAISYHHHPSQSSHRDVGPLMAVHVACALTREHVWSDGRSNAVAAPGLDMPYLEEVGVAGRLDEWRRFAAGFEDLVDSHGERASRQAHAA